MTTRKAKAAPAARSLAADAEPQNAPTIATPPKIAGTPVVGQTLSVDDGEWDQTPDSISKQWLADDVNIPDGEGTWYVVTEAELGKMIHCLVTATNADGSDTAASDNVGPVVEAEEPPVEPPDLPEVPDMYSVANEQRARSAAIQQMGVEAWKEAHDERLPEDRRANLRQIPGVGPANISETVGPPPEAYRR